MTSSVVDLHLHTTASDGRLSPKSLVQLIAKRGIRIAAITDHDTTDGLEEALTEASRHSGLTIIPGIELSADVPGTEVHMLGYFKDYRDVNLQRSLMEFRKGREERAQQIVKKLADMGLFIDWAQVQSFAQGAVGRPHIAQAMVEAGHVKTFREAFDRYLGRDGLVYSERVKLSPEGAVELIRSAGGFAVLAHPIYTDNYRQLLPNLRQMGLVGMEVYYSTLSSSAIGELGDVARAEGLLPCGGSDFHGVGTSDEAEPGQAGPPLEIGEQLLAMLRGPTRD